MPYDVHKSNATMVAGFHWLLLCVLVPASISAWISKFQFSPELFLTTIVIIYSGTRLSIIATYGLNKIVELMFWLYCYIFFGLSEFLQIAEHQFPWHGTYDAAILIKGGLIILIGLVAFDLAKPIKCRTDVHSNPSPRFEISRYHLYIVSIISVVLMIYATVRIGGFHTLLLNRTAFYALLAEQYDLKIQLAYIALAKTIVYALFIVALAFRLRTHKRTLILTIFVLVLGLFTALENNPLSTARFQVGTIVLSTFFVLPWKKSFAWIAVYGMIIAMIFIYPYADAFRFSNNINISNVIEHNKVESLLVNKADYDSYQQVVNGVRYVQRDGFQFGRQITGALLFWVPRSMWPDKPIPTGTLIAEKVSYSYTNLSSPLWIELYVDGGWLLLIVGFYFYGRLVRWLDTVRVRGANATTFWYLFATIFAGYEFFILRGPLMPAIAYLSPVIPVILCCSKYKRLRVRASASPVRKELTRLTP